MSCHDIGRGMNSVVKTTISLMDQEKISKDAAKTIINSCARGVNWCDGNTYEATDYIRKCICGNCMRLVPAGEKLYSVWTVSNDVHNMYNLDDNLASDGLCEDCFDLVLNEHCGDSEAGARERKYIEENYSPKDYTSTGEYTDNNNGCRWL